KTAYTITPTITVEDGSPTPRGKKRKLSSDSTVSAAPEDDDVESLNESDIEAIVREGSPTPQITSKGRVVGGNRGYQNPARFNKRTARVDDWAPPALPS